MSEQPAGADDPRSGLLALYDSALPQVYGYLLSRCGQRALAEDLTAETFLAAVDAVRREPPAPVSTPWLVGVARHKLVDHWRRQAREDRSLRSLGGAAAAPDDPWDVRLDVLRARQVLDELGPHHRLVLTLRYLDGLVVPQGARLPDLTVRATQALPVGAHGAFRRPHAETRAEVAK